MQNSVDVVACPFCQQLIKSTAQKCKHCGKWLSQSNPTPEKVCPFCAEKIELDATKCNSCDSILSNTLTDSKVWGVVCIPLIAFIIYVVISGIVGTKDVFGIDAIAWFGLISSMITAKLVDSDINKLVEVGINRDKRTALESFSPIYLYKRAGLLKQGQHYFWICTALFIFGCIALN